MSRVLTTLAALADEVARGDRSIAEALGRVAPEQIGASLFEAAAPAEATARLVAASPGVARGVLATSLAQAEALVARGLSVVLAIDETEAEDVPLMQKLAGVIALASGLTGHAAIVCRALGLPCLLGAARARASDGTLALRDVDVVIPREGFVGMCGASGAVFVAPFVYRGPTGALAQINGWLDTAGAPVIAASIVSEEERALADAIGVSARVIVAELPTVDPVRLSRIAEPWSLAQEGAPDAAVPIAVTRVVARRLALFRAANPA